jgi:chloramphenicol-sensitive protein RarD
MISNGTATGGDESKVFGNAEIGLAYALAAYLWWGFMPLYFRQVQDVPAVLVLAHRVVWSFVLLGVIVTAMRRWDELRAVLAQRRTLALLAASTLLLGCNWGVFIYAVQTHRVVQASLGYFIVPLVSAALGVTFLRERLRAGQWLAIALAAGGVVMLTWVLGTLPRIALAITFSWSGYSLVRKVAPVGPLVGVTVETALLLPAAVIYILATIYLAGAAPLSSHDYGWLLLAGVVTSVPLICFTAAARRLRLSTLGFLQYLTPTVQFLLAVLAFGEPFTRANAAGFVLIWTALIVYSLDSLRAYQAAPPPVVIPEL